jgi:hypothetical protein
MPTLNQLLLYSQGMGRKWLAGVVLVVLLAFASGCGGSGSGGSSGGGSTDSTDPPSASTGHEASAEFLDKGGSNKSMVEYGHEGSLAEREAAGAVLSENLEARANKDFATQCATVNKETVEEITVGETGNRERACPKDLEKMAKPFAKTRATRRDTLDPPIAAIRVKGNSGFALYHGTDGTNYAMRMEKEDGQWRVGSLLANRLE